MSRQLMFAMLGVIALAPSNDAIAELRAGAAIVDVTPVQFPVVVNGGFFSRSTDQVTTRLFARAIVLDDGTERLAIVVVDSCMIPRPLLDEAKQAAAQRTKIRPDRMLISATHTHTAPAAMSCLGTGADPTYVPYLREKVAEAIAAAEQHLEPARVGWSVANAAEFTAVRRWILRPDRIGKDPFGNRTVRATMHAGSNWDDVTGESGPEDPDLLLISIQSIGGRPIAVLGNFSMHYFSGERGLSADYFGLFCKGFEDHVGRGDRDGPAPFVAIMSHGCSGDIWRRDYTKPASSRKDDLTIARYTQGLLKIALGAYEGIAHRAEADLAMAEARMKLNYRVPDAERLEWARRVVAELGDRPPKTKSEVYAGEQIILHERQSTEVVVQALRIGDIAIATTPNETYALTGLKLKLQSPLLKTMVIELANGGDGYIPPPAQHVLGGYNTWPARSAGLEVQAEPKVVEAALGLLERVAGRPRRQYRQSQGAASKALLAAKPIAYWRLDEFSAPRAVDLSGRDHDAIYEPGVVFFLAGPRSEKFCSDDEQNRAAHFAGGRMRSRIAGLGDHYSVSMWFWNGMPVAGRDIAGWMFSRGRDQCRGPSGDHVGIGGAANHPGKLVYVHGDDSDSAKLPIAGRTNIERWTWNHMVFVRDGDHVQIYLNGNEQPEIKVKAPVGVSTAIDQLFFGGRCDNDSNWEGRLDEIAVYDRALSANEVKPLASP